MKKLFHAFLKTEAIVITSAWILCFLLRYFVDVAARALVAALLFIPLGALLVLQIIICAFLCRQRPVRKQVLFTLLVLLLALFLIRATNLDLRLNCSLLAKQRIEMIMLAQRGHLQPISDGVFAMPDGKRYLAYDGLRLRGKAGERGAIFYYATGLLDETQTSALLYLPDGVDSSFSSYKGKVVVLGQQWVYVNIAPEDEPR